jgi:hypothetical protein
MPRVEFQDRTADVRLLAKEPVMGNRLDLSWESYPHDGASTPLGSSAAIERNDYDELFRAWCEERHESIELGLCLDEVVRLLKRMLAAGGVTEQSRRRAKSLFRAIREASGRSDTA